MGDLLFWQPGPYNVSGYQHGRLVCWGARLTQLSPPA